MRLKHGFTLIALGACCLAGCTQRTYQTRSEVASVMHDFSKAKRYDKAVEIGKKWIETHPKDSVIHQQIGLALVQKAGAHPDNNTQYLQEASGYFEGSIQIDPNNPLTLFNAAWGFEVIADLSASSQRCGFYQKARTTLHLEEPLLAKDQYSSGGNMLSTAPLRRAHDELGAQLSDKMLKASCN